MNKGHGSLKPETVRAHSQAVSFRLERSPLSPEISNDTIHQNFGDYVSGTILFPETVHKPVQVDIRHAVYIVQRWFRKHSVLTRVKAAHAFAFGGAWTCRLLCILAVSNQLCI